MERESEVQFIMPKNYESKAAIIAEIKELLQKSQSAVIVDYRGLTVEEDTALRKSLREAGVSYKVLKNTYVKRAADELGITGLDEALNGPTAVAFGLEDAAAPARILKKFISDKKKMEIKCGIYEGKAVDTKVVDALADLPTKEVLISMLLGTLNETVAKLARTLKAIADKMEETAA